VRPCAGERDRHAERRHLLLDALLAAEQTLIITCDGSDVTTNRQTRFAVQLTELLDVVDATLEPTGGGAGHDTAVLTRHPLHAYDERNFDLAGVTAPGIFSFDDVMCRAADARRHRVDVAGAGSWRRFAIAAPVPEDVTPAQLCDACVSPARTLLRDGLGVRVPGEVERVDHAIPLSVDKLQAAFIGRRLLERYGRCARALRVDGGTADNWEAAARAAVEEWAQAERLAGGRPPGLLIDDTLSGVAAEIDAIALAAECSGLDRVAILGADGVVDVDLELKVTGAVTGRRAGPSSLRLVDRVVGIGGQVLCRLAYRRPKPRTIIAAVLDLAALVATTGDSAWRALTVTRGASGGSGGAACHLIQVVAVHPQAAAFVLLRTAAELRVAALSVAVPVFEQTTKTLYERNHVDEDELVGSDYSTGDLSDVANRFVWGDLSVSELTAMSPSPQDLANSLWGAVEAFAAVDPVGDRAGSR
jgi:exodeoxyribonuclease V gamma subunit